MDKWYKEPLLHFLVLGALLFFLTYEEEVNVITKEITVTREKLIQLKENLTKNKRGEPTEQELKSELAYYLEDEILYREALRLGLDKNEPLIRKVLIDKMKYVASDGVNLNSVTDEELRSYFNGHRERFTQPIQRVSFSHIYLNPTKDMNYREHALKLYSKVKGKPYRKCLDKEGNIFLGGNHFTHLSKKELRKYFSRTFIDQLFTLPLKKWSKPISSEFGIHLIYMDDLNISDEIGFESVKLQVKDAWLIESNHNAYKQLSLRLKEEYTIHIENSGL